MRSLFKLMIFGVSLIICLSVISPNLFAELIEPTKTLEGEPAATGRLTVLSEPPGLGITLDGNSFGKTPVFLLEVEAGIHTLRIKDSETEIFIEPGKTVKISLFKEEFVLIPVKEKQVQTQAEIPAVPETGKAQPIQPRDPIQVRAQEQREQAQDRWQRYIDGSSPTF